MTRHASLSLDLRQGQPSLPGERSRSRVAAPEALAVRSGSVTPSAHDS